MMSPHEPVVLRRATAGDVEELFRVRTSVRENHLDMEQLAERGVTFESIGAMVEDDACRIFVIEADNRVRGFSIADSRQATIFALFVEPESEGKGYGRRLLAEAERWLFDQGHSMIWLNTGRDEANRSHTVYRAAGWTLAGDADHEDVRYEKRRSA